MLNVFNVDQALKSNATIGFHTQYIYYVNITLINQGSQPFDTKVPFFISYISIIVNSP